MLDRRPYAAQDRRAVADVDVGRVLRPHLPCARRVGAVRHGFADHLFPRRCGGSGRGGHQPGSRRRRRQNFSQELRRPDRRNCGLPMAACSRPPRRSHISRREKERLAEPQLFSCRTLRPRNDKKGGIPGQPFPVPQNDDSNYSAASFTSGAAARTSASTWASNLAKFFWNMPTSARAVLSNSALSFQVLTGSRMSLGRRAAQSAPRSRNTCRCGNRHCAASRSARRSTAPASP